MGWAQRVLRWTWQVPAGAATLRCENAAGSSGSNQAFSTSDEYTVSGDGAASPRDWLVSVDAKLTAAQLAIFGAAGMTVTLQTSGRIRYNNTSGNALVLAFTDPATTIDPLYFGWAGSADITIPAGGYVESDYQCYCAWYPGDIHREDTLDLPRYPAAVGQTMLGVPYSVLHCDIADIPYLRRLEWTRVNAARIAQCYADDTAYAAVAGLTAGDPCAPLTVLLAWILSGEGPSPGEVYVYTTNDPSTHVQQGPYRVVLTEDLIGNLLSLQITEMQRRHRVALDLVLV